MEQEQTTPPPEEKQKPLTPVPIPVHNLALAPQDNSELMRMIGVIAKGGGFPDRFDTMDKQIAAFNLGRSLMGERWQLAVNHMAPIKGQMTIYGELPRSLAEQTREVQEFKVYVINKDYAEICPANKNLNDEPWAGVCEVQRKGREKKQYFYTIEEATHAGQYPAKRRDGSMNHDSPWMKFTKIMLMRKAQAIGVKFEFPDALLGANIAEYEYDEAPDLVAVKDVSPSEERVKNLNSKFKDPESA